MNLLHRYLCRSGRWKTTLEQYVLPWTLDGVDLGGNVLEVGPGPGLTTDVLQPRAGQLTCVEIDRKLARSLAGRMTQKNVTVLNEDATSMSLASGSFDTAVCFTMLHHVPSPELQDKLIAEVARVLRAGGVFAGTDTLDGGFFFHALHWFDTLVPVDPHTFPARLEAAGFRDVRVDVNPYAFRFWGRKG